MSGPVSDFIDAHYRHFNAATLKDAADAYVKHIEDGGLMFLSMARAMSTGELGCSLAPMIREGKVSGICCTGANLEEDLFNLVAHDHYERLPDYHNLTPEDEKRLYARHINRVTDTDIPEDAAMTPIEQRVTKRWRTAEDAGESVFPHEVLYDLIRSGELKPHYQGDPAESWMLAAAEMDLPLYVPGWEDSTLGNVF